MSNIRTKWYAGHGQWTCLCEDCGEEFPMDKRSSHICPTPFYVYCIQAEILGYIKIGIAQDVEKRLVALQCGSPDKLKIVKTMLAGTRLKAQEKEATLHTQFAEHRVHGEWFKPEVLNVISALESNIY